MIKSLLMKWFGLEPEQCKTCEVLRAELDYARRQNEVLLGRLLTSPVKEDTTAPVNEKPEPVGQSGGRRFIPHAVQQQMIAKEDSKTLELMKQKKKEIEGLEKEIGVGEEKDNASKVS